jgi:hypothetical protein
MALSKKLRLTIILVGVFSITFPISYAAISLTQSAHSLPSGVELDVEGMNITFGPPPNSTNIPTNTAITLDTMASARLDDLRLTPEVPIAQKFSEVTGPINYLTTFYPAQLLQPATTYNVSVTIVQTPVSWVFTTSVEPFSPSISFYLATNALSISIGIAGLGVLIVGLLVWFKYRQVLGKP